VISKCHLFAQNQNCKQHSTTTTITMTTITMTTMPKKATRKIGARRKFTVHEKGGKQTTIATCGT
jgi:hypothetical protein